VEGIDERLSFDPNVETRNRKRMDENGALRVYSVVDDGARVVNVLAVGRKERDLVVIGGEEIEL